VAGVQSVERAFAVLGCLAGGPAGVSELASRVGLPKSTVARLLSTLEHLGAVEQVAPGGAYRVGEALVQLGGAVRANADLVVAAHPHLVELANATGEATGLSVLDGADVHYLDQVASEHAVSVRDWTGERVAAHVVSSGLVLLAHAPDPVISRYLAGPLPRFTDRSMINPDDLRDRLRRVRAQGYEWVFEEFAADINSVAAPVRDGEGRVVAAVHAHGPSYRFPVKGAAASVADRVIAAAARLSKRLGHVGAP